LAEKTLKWEDTIRYTTEAAEDCGILVLRSGFAGGDTGRKLDTEEFQGFALCDKYAPLIFINGADFAAAQIFTLAHELAHIWIGETGVSYLQKTYSIGGDNERYCNSVAAEVLLPLEEIRASWKGGINDTNEIQRLSHKYKISRIVVARRARDAGLLTEEEFASYYKLIATAPKKPKSNWSDFYAGEKYRNSRRFSITILQEALAGRIMQRDAMQFLGIKKESTLRKYAHSLQGGVEWPIF
jgi:Zn-dependent peptidase ImmA (M78 family)